MSETQTDKEVASLRKMQHEIANSLAVITMGLQALGGVREEANAFAEILEVMQENVDLLKQQVARVVELSADSLFDNSDA
jgi:signal transduction histidine kinase